MLYLGKWIFKKCIEKAANETIFLGEKYVFSIFVWKKGFNNKIHLYLITFYKTLKIV